MEDVDQDPCDVRMEVVRVVSHETFEPQERGEEAPTVIEWSDFVF